MNDHKRRTPSTTLQSLTASARRVGMLSVLMLLVVSSGCDSSETNPSSDHDATSADVLPDIQEPPADLLAPSQIANFEEAIEEGHPAIIVAVVDGEYSQIYSFGELESGETPDGQTLFELGHTTKTFSSLLLADAVVAGDVTLEQPVQELLPDFEIPTRNGLEITLGHLATEFSGLPNDPTDLQPYDFANPYTDYDLAKLKGFLADHELERDPGSEHWFSHVGYAILGQALGEKASSDYATLLKSKIFEPLGMSASVLDVREADGSNLAKGHTNQGFETPNWDVNVFAPSTGIVSNGDDMLRYLQAHMGHLDTPLYPAMQLTHQMHAGGSTTTQIYGLGWDLFPLEGREMLWREGATQGYASFIGLRADGSRGVVILTNISDNLLSLALPVLMGGPEDEVAEDDEPDVTEEEDADASPDVEENSDELMSAELMSQYERAIEMQGYPAIIAAVVDGDRSKVYSFGYLDSGVEPDGETLFEIGFITKTFTALLLADAVEARDVTLEQPLQELLPDFNIPTRNGLEITLEHVATQRSGLPIQPTNFYPPDRSNPYADYNLAMLKSFLSDYTLRDDPGAVYQHSVVDYGILGYALSETASSDYATLLEMRIFEPLGMSSSLSDVSQADASRLAIGHKASGQVVANWNFDAFTPAGAIVSSGHDMLRYLKANMGQLETPLYSAMQLAHQVHAPGPHINARSGLGWMTGPSDSGDIIEHSGVTGGYSAYIGFLADGSRGVVVLTNIASGANHLGRETLTD